MIAVDRDDHVVAFPVLGEAASHVVDHRIRAQRSCLVEVAAAGDSGHVGRLHEQGRLTGTLLLIYLGARIQRSGADAPAAGSTAFVPNSEYPRRTSNRASPTYSLASPTRRSAVRGRGRLLVVDDEDVSV